MRTKCCILMEISMEIRIAKFWKAINEFCFTRDEFPFSASTRIFLKKKTGNFKDVVTLILYQRSSKWLEISVRKMRCNLSGH